MIHFATIWTIECLLNRAALSGLILISPWIHTVKNDPYSFLYILLTRISNEGFFIDRYYLQKMNTNDHILWSQSKARVFLWLWPIAFVTFCGFLMFCIHFLILFVVQWLNHPNQWSHWLTRRYNWSRQCFQLLPYVSYNFEFICYKKMYANFWSLSLFSLISLSFDVVWKRQAKTHLLLVNKLISVLVLNLTNGFLVLSLRVSIFFSIIADFFSSFCFIVQLSHYWQIQLKISLVGKTNRVKKVDPNMLIVFFNRLRLWAETLFYCKIQRFFVTM